MVSKHEEMSHNPNLLPNKTESVRNLHKNVGYDPGLLSIHDGFSPRRAVIKVVLSSLIASFFELHGALEDAKSQMLAVEGIKSTARFRLRRGIRRSACGEVHNLQLYRVPIKRTTKHDF